MSRIIVITGASSGIGAALARRMSTQACSFVLHARSSRAALEAVAEEVRAAGCDVEMAFGDLAEPGTATSLVDLATSRFGRIDALVANAGFPVLKSLDEGTMGDIEYAFRGNLFSFFELVRAARPQLGNTGDGRVVALGSFTAHMFRTGFRQFPISAASKGGLETAVRSLACALAPHSITVNCVIPGLTRKERGTSDALDPAEEHASAAQVPLGRLGEPDEVAAAIEFLLSRDAGYITGQCLHVNGGLV